MKVSIEDLARSVIEYLEREGAVRNSIEHINGYKTVWEIVEALKFDYSLWYKIKAEVNHQGRRDETGYSLCFVQGRGHYKGFLGEDITNVLSKYKVAKGWERHLKSTRETILHCSEREKFWIAQRDKDFYIEEEEVKHYA